jgi:hypothetical protein
MLAVEFSNLSFVERRSGHPEHARSLIRESLQMADAMRYDGLMASTFVGLAGVELDEGDPERAATLLGATESWLDRLGEVLDPADQPEFDRTLAQVREALGEAPLQAAHARGRSMARDEGLAYALESVRAGAIS